MLYAAAGLFNGRFRRSGHAQSLQGELSVQCAAQDLYLAVTFRHQSLLHQLLTRDDIAVAEHVQCIQRNGHRLALLELKEPVLAMRFGVTVFLGRAAELGEHLPDAIVTAPESRFDAGTGAALLALGAVARGRSPLAAAPDALALLAERPRP